MVPAAGTDNIIPPFERLTLSNGLEVVLVERHEQPMISCALLIKSGSASDPIGKSGLSIVMSRLFRGGTKSHPGTKHAEMIDSIGGYLEIKSFYKDEILIKGDFLSRDLFTVLKAYSEMVISPIFTDEGVERLKARVASLTLQNMELPEPALIETLYRLYYGNKGYGRPLTGIVDEITSITTDDVIKFHNDYVRPENSALILVGDAKIAAARDMITRFFLPWRRADKIPAAPSQYSLPDSSRIMIMDNGGLAAATFIIGCPAVPPGSDDFAGLVLLNYILGQGGGLSRLNKGIVVESGLATYIRTAIDWSKGNGMFYIIGSGPNNNATDAIGRTLEILNEIRDIRVSQKELDEAKIYLSGQFLSLFETPSGIADEIAFLLSSNVTPDYSNQLLSAFDKIDPARLKKIAEKYLDPKRLTMVVYGPASLLEPSLSEIAPVEIISTK
jgi:predicted Zn-dependent peptidase